MTTLLKLFVDENLPPTLGHPLTSIFQQHRFRSARQESTLGMDDRDLFAHLGQSEFDAIITLDSRQLEDPDERAALAAHGLHWIGVPPIKARGQMFLALLTGTVAAGLPHVFEHWQDTPHAYHLRALGEPHSFQPHYEPL